MDDEWEKELDARNKAKAGIEVPTEPQAPPPRAKTKVPVESKPKAQPDAKTSINEETAKIDWIRQKSHDEQVKYFGGGDAGEQRLALLDSGVITKDDELERLYKKNDKGVRVKKTLQELADDGIMTVSREALDHSTQGIYIAPSKQYPKGRLNLGGHSQKSMDVMSKRIPTVCALAM